MCVKKQMELFRGFPAELLFSRGSRCTDSIRIQAFPERVNPLQIISADENAP